MKLLQTKEVAERLDVAPITVLRLFDTGALSGVVLRAGKRKRVIRFRPEAVEKFITSREVRAGK